MKSRDATRAMFLVALAAFCVMLTRTPTRAGPNDATSRPEIRAPGTRAPGTQDMAKRLQRLREAFSPLSF